MKSPEFFVTLCILFFSGIILQSQSILYQETFDAFPFGGFPGESWSNSPSSPHQWEWRVDGEAPGMYWDDREPIGSPSGMPAIGFNSDSLANETTISPPHTAVVTSPFLPNFSTSGELYLSFYQYYRNFESTARVEVVNPEDPTDFFVVYTNEHIGKNIETSHKERVVVDISGHFPFSPIIQIRFVFEGNQYFWLIDDVTIYDSYPFPVTIPQYIGDSLASFNKPYDVNCNGVAIVPNQLVVQFKPGLTDMEKQEVRDSFGINNFEGCMCDQLELWDLGILPFDPNANLTPQGLSTGIDELKAAASASSRVDEADPNFYNWNELQDSLLGPFPEIQDFPDLIDPSLTDPTLVAILDTGIDYENDSLRSYIWQEIAEDPQNCLPGDSIGWNFVERNNNSMDNHSHGTHLAGIIRNNLPRDEAYKIIPVKTHDQYGVSDLFDVGCGFYYALQSGAEVINCSWGWLGDASDVLSAVIDSAEIYNALVIAASGNDGLFLDTLRQYPACYEHANLLSIGSVNTTLDTLSSFSNLSANLVDIVAPGENVESYVLNDSLGIKTGTSMSAPAVAAQAMVIYEEGWGEVTYSQVTDCILNSAEVNENFGQLVAEGRVLSKTLNNCPPVAVEAPIPFDPEVSMYPNPTFGRTILEFHSAITTSGQILVFDLYGRKVRSISFDQIQEGEKILLNLGKQPAGLYLISISSLDQQKAFRLVKSP